MDAGQTIPIKATFNPIKPIPYQALWKVYLDDQFDEHYSIL